MANPAIGWEGSGTRPGSRRRPPGKGTVYWIDLDKELDDLFTSFASSKGMEKRDAAKALMAIAMGLLPPYFWEDSEAAENANGLGFTGPERTNLIRQIFPKGSGHTNRAPHAVWRQTYSMLPEMRGSAAGIDYIGLLIEREKDKLKAVYEGKRKLELTPNQYRKLIADGEEGGIEDELIEYRETEEREFAEAQLKILKAERRLHLLERGIIENPEEGGELAELSGRVRRKKLPDGSEHLDPYERERQKNLGKGRGGDREMLLDKESRVLRKAKASGQNGQDGQRKGSRTQLKGK